MKKIFQSGENGLCEIDTMGIREIEYLKRDLIEKYEQINKKEAFELSSTKNEKEV